MKFGVFDHVDEAGVPIGKQFADRIRFAQALDRGGFYGYHIAEHHATPLGLASSPSLLLTAIAIQTKRLRFGPLVYLLPFYHPIRLLEEICTIDQLSGGRFELGVGRGVVPHEAEAFGLDFAKTRDMYHEAFEVLMAGFRTDELTFKGKHYHYDKLPLRFTPVQRPHPPLWYGYGLPQNASWPAANDVNVVMLGLGPYVRSLTERYLEERAKAGRDMTRLPLMGVSRHVVVADTDAEAMKIARRAYKRWRDSFFWIWRRINDAPHIAPIYPESFDEMMKMGNAIAGSPATVRDFIKRDVEETKVNYYLSWLAFGDLTVEESVRSVELFASDIMPAFAERQAAE